MAIKLRNIVIFLAVCGLIVLEYWTFYHYENKAFMEALKLIGVLLITMMILAWLFW